MDKAAVIFNDIVISIDALLSLSFSLKSFNAINEDILSASIAMCNSLFDDRFFLKREKILFLREDFSNERDYVELIFEITMLHIGQ